MSWSGYIPGSLLSTDDFDPGFESDDFDWDDTYSLACDDPECWCQVEPEYGEEASYP